MKPDELYRVKDGDLYQIVSVDDGAVTLMRVQCCQRTLDEHARFLSDNKHAPNHLRVPAFDPPAFAEMVVESRWFARKDVTRETCAHPECVADCGDIMCEICGAEIVVTEPDQCPLCHGEGWYDDGEWCHCPKGKADEAANARQYAYMAPLARQHNRAIREGDHELAASIKAEALR